jgi:hypothetical protein
MCARCDPIIDEMQLSILFHEMSVASRIERRSDLTDQGMSVGPVSKL